MQKKESSSPEKPFRLTDGKLYFTRETERRIFFFMTLIMLVSGAIIKLL